ncbi:MULTISPECIES: PTS glucose transporter subunit IIA [unclassified Cryobacterium]|uniref:PTS sugar transporter subunit IIA n=1 Tax=unclassified Cryobacterium TaxID=2649013 RepID=UPI002AB54861|nr:MULTISPECIES: PTS glucose transporter subunit IIA [unclassified Cryobacterium]MDY7529011.1 PTS glucose transporter subunit IIA [Cryobacterium sp. 10C2]MDY7558822.1 PTS glucose transporter subunit IIA [Cryobacterium sp. 10C3]MEB0202024.1 PTS glucose transporter subunit IIA [Cryobacterium sp. 5I3]MEB0285656.1 PTS glucose transporter subunit IIA [Cryobacterium sp. 10S3]MEB0289937.1 PTS glucose transporter subunit IIA [Cryobacterium sp. 10C2]
MSRGAPVVLVTPVVVLAPVPGRAVGLAEVPDPTFAQAIVGPGAAIDPPRGMVDAIAPISGRLLKVFPHAFVILSPDGIGVLVHLGIDTVELRGEGFTLRAKQGDQVAAGDVIVTWDSAAVEAGGRNPIVPVIILERTHENIDLADAVTDGADLAAGDLFLTVTS